MTMRYDTPTATSADADGNEPPPQPPPEDQPPPVALLNIRFITTAGEELHFKMKPTTRLSKAMSTYCDRWGRARQGLRFLFDGERVLDHHTPKDLDLGDGDTIEVHEEQIGGGV
ncbi:hypothetical protein M409DRAFT_26653 [Zasmidium cellare ATCC 36951]|uniref:Ubiquitin-like domain-containing protein n=1 Tax=Zasmidium cellare ATCC 36951 TaxID=1080233 RepID=A0A6A6C983_ZASCE|nr:uncharacterized protein M409DRAFT_26653 [Zasmidium cellare ATCC 36951]KAF2162798.1 hypothetical protein M409DRAFT_26653 [Zasmidium cellare ATCC 36951]